MVIDPDAAVGLCLRCRHVRVVPSRTGQRYYRCERAATDAGYPKYPRLPVVQCPGYEPARDRQASDNLRSTPGDRDREREAGKAAARAGTRLESAP